MSDRCLDCGKPCQGARCPTDAAVHGMRSVLPFTGFSNRQIKKVFGSTERFNRATVQYVRRFANE